MKQNVSSYLWCCKTGSKQGSKECGLERPERARQKLGDSWLTLQPHQNQTTSFDPCSHKPHFLCVNTPDIFQLWHCFHCFLNSSLMNFTISNNHWWLTTAAVTLSFTILWFAPQKRYQKWLHGYYWMSHGTVSLFPSWCFSPHTT